MKMMTGLEIRGKAVELFGDDELQINMTIATKCLNNIDKVLKAGRAGLIDVNKYLAYVALLDEHMPDKEELTKSILEKDFEKVNEDLKKYLPRFMALNDIGVSMLQ